MATRNFFEYEDEETHEKYYYNCDTEETQYEFPNDAIIFDAVTREIIYSPAGRSRSSSTQADSIAAAVEHSHQNKRSGTVTQWTAPHFVEPRSSDAEAIVEAAPTHEKLLQNVDEVLPPPEVTNSRVTACLKDKKVPKSQSAPAKQKGIAQSKESEVIGSLDQASLRESIHKFQTPAFAQRFFKTHRCGGFFSRRTMPIEDLISYTTDLLKEPLLMSLPKQFAKLATQTFEDILSYTGARPQKNAALVPSKLVGTLYQCPALRDEIYFQLIKQTTKCPNTNILERAWELFLIVSTLFPSTRDSEVWISAHILKSSQETESTSTKILRLAHFTYIRFESRCCIGEVASQPSVLVLSQIPKDPFTVRPQFGVSLYEVMWNQKADHMKLPIPYIEYYLIEMIKKKGGFETQGIFRLPGNLKLVGELADEVKDTYDCLERAALHDLGSLLKRWFRDLTNPVIPIQALEDFRKAYDDKQMIKFVQTKLPKTHMCTLMYLIGFLQDAAKHADLTQMHAKNLAIVFGPNVVQVNDNEPGRIQMFSQMGNEFVLQLIEEWDTSELYPLPIDLLK